MKRKAIRQQQLFSSPTNTTTCFYLPDECWESIFKFLTDDDGKINNRYMEPLSVVSKEFLSITNRLRFSLTISNTWQSSFLPLIFHRFSNLTSLHLSKYINADLNVLLREISSFPLKLRSLHLSVKPTILDNGLRAFSKNITTLTSLTCFNIEYTSINIFDFWLIADCFPNLKLLDLNHCYKITQGIGHVLWRCSNITHLNLAYCSRLKLNQMKFQLGVLKLEVLNLSHTNTDDQTLHVISKSCCRLLQLLLVNCSAVTKRGVKHVVENCTQLREINLRCCFKVHANIVASIVFSRPSLRKIIAPYPDQFSDGEMELFSRQGCLVY